MSFRALYTIGAQFRLKLRHNIGLSGFTSMGFTLRSDVALEIALIFTCGYRKTHWTGYFPAN